jgi:hypothetical protein
MEGTGTGHRDVTGCENFTAKSKKSKKNKK